MVATGGMRVNTMSVAATGGHAHAAGAPDRFEQALKVAATQLQPAKNANEGNSGPAASMDLRRVQAGSQDVMARLRALTEQGDKRGLQREVFGILRDTARRSPTSRAVDEQVKFLRRNGPQDRVFLDAVETAADYFNRGQIRDAADNIAKTYATKGPLAAAQLLAWYTDPSRCDPLTASRILEAAQDTISKIIKHLGAQDLDLSPGDDLNLIHAVNDLGTKEAILANLSRATLNAILSPEAVDVIRRIRREINAQIMTYAVNTSTTDVNAAMATYFANPNIDDADGVLDPETKQAIFGYLSEAAQDADASADPESASSIERMANEINTQNYTDVASSIINGNGSTLPVEMILASPSLELSIPVSLGLNGLSNKNSEIANFASNRSPYQEPARTLERHPAELSNARWIKS